ncbi:TonB-dependent receptor [Novosphingobium sp.]|uniref:TonB-dependent receptor plug domain-containing protein n=1 Tax=Novosphingobium sp. TaxID=1874826 RepID=UPI00260F6B46|nr:TonB-dependent receptor [Novosphingobium sp.]
MRRALLPVVIVALGPIPAMAAPSAPEPTATPGPQAGQPPAPAGSGQTFTPADFLRFAPRNAFDMLVQVPGFQIRDSEQLRGLGQATGNVLFNGQRPSSKADSLETQLARIPADTVTRIEILDGATLGLPGLSGQVANVVFSARALSGQFAWRPQVRTHFTDPLLTRANVSVSGRAGPVDYQLGLDNGDAARSGAGGPTTISGPSGQLIERRFDVWNTHYDQPKLTGRFVFDLPGDAIANLNLQYQQIYDKYDEDGLRRLPGQADRRRTVLTTADRWTYEVGGDVEFGAGPGRLKMIGLRRSSREPFAQTVIVTYADGAPRTGDRFTQLGRTGETIARGEYSWKMLGGDWQLSGEGAFNRLTSAASTGLIDTSGQFVDTPLAGGSGGVAENRYEGLLSFGRPISHRLSFQLIAGAERSTISQTSPGGLRRTFVRPKGSFSLLWKPSDSFDAALRLRRRILQLDFYDFLARAFLNDDRANASNAELRPQQDWTVEFEANKRLGPWGSSKLRVIYRDVQDYVDVIPVPGGEGVGNLPSSWAGAIDWTSTFQFDPAGWKGARLTSRVVLQDSSVRDPFTGEQRAWSGFVDRVIELGFRQDIPKSAWAYGGDMEYNHVLPSYRSSQVDRLYEGPIFASVFVENKNVMGLTLRGEVRNIWNARSRRQRTFYEGLRNASPIASIEDRDRMIGAIFSFSVRGTF